MTTAALRGGAVVLAAVLGAGTCVAAPNLDVAVTAANATSNDVSKFGVIMGWPHHDPLWEGERWRLMLRHEVELAAWRVPRARNLMEFGYSPVLRLEYPLASADSALFVEASIGVRLLSHTRVSPDRSLSTAFQFSDMLGAGWQWGPDGRSAVGVRFQHISNADIKKPNPGINFGQIYFRYRF